MNESRSNTRQRNDNTLILDNILSSQPELGPSIPEGGYGWVIFIITLFYQAFIPSLIVSFGLLLAIDRIQKSSLIQLNPKCWDNSLQYVSLFFIATWTIVDSTNRSLIAQSRWPKLIASSGTCLTCSGLLFLWMGLNNRYYEIYLYILAGIFSGIGASINMSQCEILLAQYFRLKLPILTHISNAIRAIGFIVTPIIVGRYILFNPLTDVVLWYQAIILQGLILNLFLRKPMYLKAKSGNNSYYITAIPDDDDEDIFSKNPQELQIQNKPVPTNKNESIKITAQELPSTSTTNETKQNDKNDKKNWTTFEDKDEEISKYERNMKQWETFEENKNKEDVVKNDNNLDNNKQNNKENDEQQLERNKKSLYLEMSFDTSAEQDIPSTTSINGFPIPLFHETPTSTAAYSYEIIQDDSNNLPTPIGNNSQHNLQLPMENIVDSNRFFSTILELLKQPTFYKTLITVINTKWSLYVFFTLYPSYLYQEITDIQKKQLATIIGCISIGALIFSLLAYWINIERKIRPKVLMLLTWLGAFGYFTLTDYRNKVTLIIAGTNIVVSLAALQHIGNPLLSLTIKGEPTKEYHLICLLSGLSFLLFLPLYIGYKQIFHLMAVMNLFTGFLWLANYIYKRLSRNHR